VGQVASPTEKGGLMAEIRGIAICRQASDYLKPGCVTGFACRVCSKELQVSPLSVDRIKDGSLIPMCNDCGFAIEKRLRGAQVPVEMIFSPEAKKRLDELAFELVNPGGNN
jgi:hypothetical protein